MDVALAPYPQLANTHPASIKNDREIIVLKLSGDRLGATVIMDHTKVIARLLILHCFLLVVVPWSLSHIAAFSLYLV